MQQDLTLCTATNVTFEPYHAFVLTMHSRTTLQVAHACAGRVRADVHADVICEQIDALDDVTHATRHIRGV